jgi:hypothetical protein
MDTPCFTQLALSIVLCTSDQPINCQEDHPVNIPTKFGSKWQNLFKEENNGRQRGRTPSDGYISPENNCPFIILHVEIYIIIMKILDFGI